MTIKSVKDSINDSIKVKNHLLEDDYLIEQIVQLASRCTASLKMGGKILTGVKDLFQTKN